MFRRVVDIDLGVLVDIISNLAGMMILLACVALLLQHRAPAVGGAPENAKPINYPLAYLPNKRSVALCLKNGRLYDLPEAALLEAVVAQAAAGNPIERLELTTDAVAADIEATPTATGFLFHYYLRAEGGIPLHRLDLVRRQLDALLADYPSSEYFVTIHSWPEHFQDFHELREYLLEKGMEVGWTPRTYVAEDESRPDISYAIGHYDPSYISIKAQ